MGRDHGLRPRLFPLVFMSFFLLSIGPPTVPCTTYFREKQPLKQSLKMIVHASFDLVDPGLDHHAVAERVHEAQGFATEGKMIIL
jgi:hypothetical protein